MSDSTHCLQCGAPLPKPGAPCRHCLLAAGSEAGDKPQFAPDFLVDLDLPLPPQPHVQGKASVSHESSTLVSGEGFLTQSGPIDEKPGDRIGRYKLLQQIGKGGFGVVYMAEQEEPIKRRVALKVIKLGMDTNEVIARFEAERQALALMDHPNIAKVLDAGASEKGRPFFVMELVRGIAITDYCDQNALSTRERLELFAQVCQAVQHAHQKGIIHRDLKPSNILVTLQDGVPVPKVIDFGIAKATAGQTLTDKTVFTAFEQFIGTPAYVSPEQAEMSALDIDARSDIYSLGVLLYELLTSRTPFESKELLASGLDAMRRIIREKEPPRPSTRLSRLKPDEQTTIAKRHKSEPLKLIQLVRGDLDWIVMKCLEKDRTRRYETAAVLAEDIQHHLNNQVVSARPPSRLYRIQRFVRRNKLAFVAASAVAFALAIGLAIPLKLSNDVRPTKGAHDAGNQAEAPDQRAHENTGQGREMTVPTIRVASVGRGPANIPVWHPTIGADLTAMLIQEMAKLSNFVIMASNVDQQWRPATYTLTSTLSRFSPGSVSFAFEVQIDWRLIDNASRELVSSGRAVASGKGEALSVSAWLGNGLSHNRDFSESALGKATTKAIAQLVEGVKRLNLGWQRQEDTYELRAVGP